VAVRYRLVLAYLGTPFAGWQRQPARRTVQGELETALARMTGGPSPSCVAAGRTDAGVHAAGQVVHFDLRSLVPPAALVRALNDHLPPEIRARSARVAPPAFDARRWARGKRYVYRAGFSPRPLPWVRLRTATVPRPTDADALRAALALLPGRRDMASFTVPDPETGSTVRTLYEVRVAIHGNGLTLTFLGDAFLRYQVRRMVGAALEVGWGRRTLAGLRELLEAPRPGARVWTAPACGLTLEMVYYRTPHGWAPQPPSPGTPMGPSGQPTADG
jgi:tRNA pseudouridine38-40 synthase